MNWNILIGCGLVVLTTFIHAGAMVAAFRWLKILHVDRWAGKSLFTKATAVAVLVLILFIASIIESAAWAATYLFVGAISGFEKALYFSTVTYTTLGFGDLVMEEPWRLLSALEAASGIIMFGWTTALIVAAVHRLYMHHEEQGDV